MSFNSFEFADEVCFSLIGNLNTLSVGNTTLNDWTTNTGDLNSAWTTGPSLQAKTIQGINSKDTYNSYMANTANFEDANQYSLADISTLLAACAQYGNFGSGGTGSTQMAQIQQFGNLVSATQQIQTASGDTETKAQASFLQQTTSSQQSISDMGNSAIGVLSTVAGLAGQSFL